MPLSAECLSLGAGSASLSVQRRVDTPSNRVARRANLLGREIIGDSDEEDEPAVGPNASSRLRPAAQDMRNNAEDDLSAEMESQGQQPGPGGSVGRGGSSVRVRAGRRLWRRECTLAAAPTRAQQQQACRGGTEKASLFSHW